MLGKLPVPGRPTNSDNSGAEPIGLLICPGGGCLDFFLSFLGGGRVVRRCWVNFQCRGVLQF